MTDSLTTRPPAPSVGLVSAPPGATAGDRASALAAACTCPVLLPGTPGYAAARVPWNVAVDQRPAAVARPRHADDLVALVRGAVQLGLRLAPQGTGHGAGPLAGRDLSEVILVRLDGWRSVEVDPARRIARVGAGALWADVVEAAAPHGLAPLHGSSPDVGVAGYTLGGGLGFYGRRHGLASGKVTAVELVTPAGELLRADASTNPDLFWAVRGGLTAVGIVTALEFELLQLRDVVAGMMLWDISRAEDVLRRWVAFCATAPDEITTSLRFMRFPPLPQLPPFLQGRSLVVLDGASLADDDERAAGQWAPFRHLDPEMDTVARVPIPAVLAMHMDPPEPTPAVGGGGLLRTLDDDAIAALLEQFGPDASTSLLFAELRQLGGALARRPEDAGALASLDAEFAFHCVAIAGTPEMAAAGRADLARGIEALAPWRTAARYLNFTEDAVDTRTGFEAADWERLVSLRRRYDPASLLVANHVVEASA